MSSWPENGLFNQASLGSSIPFADNLGGSAVSCRERWWHPIRESVTLGHELEIFPVMKLSTTPAAPAIRLAATT